MNKKEENTEEEQEVKIDLKDIGYATKVFVWFLAGMIEIVFSYILWVRQALPALLSGYWFIFATTLAVWLFVSFIYILLVSKLMKWIGGQKILEKIE